MVSKIIRADQNLDTEKFFIDRRLKLHDRGRNSEKNLGFQCNFSLMYMSGWRFWTYQMETVVIDVIFI